MAWQREKGEEHVPVLRWLPLALGCAIIFGTGTMVSKWGINLVGTQTYIFGEAVNRVLVSLIWLSLNRFDLRTPMRSRHFPIMALGNLFMVAGALSIVVALGLGQASLVVPVASSASLATLLLARIFLKEHLTPVQWAGAIAVALGIIWIGTVS
jgi:transporter family protein